MWRQKNYPENRYTCHKSKSIYTNTIHGNKSNSSANSLTQKLPEIEVWATSLRRKNWIKN